MFQNQIEIQIYTCYNNDWCIGEQCTRFGGCEQENYDDDYEYYIEMRNIQYAKSYISKMFTYEGIIEIISSYL